MEELSSRNDEANKMANFLLGEEHEEIFLDCEAPAPTPTERKERMSRKLPVKRKTGSLPDANWIEYVISVRVPFQENCSAQAITSYDFGDIYTELPPLTHSANAETVHDAFKYNPGTQFEEILDGLDGYNLNDLDDESDDESYVGDELSSDDEVQRGDKEDVEGNVTRNLEEIGTALSGFTHKSFQCSDKCFATPESEKWEDELLLAVGKQWITMDACRKYVRMYAIKNKFEVLFQKNCGDKIILKCRGEGCPWRCYVKRKNDGHTAEIKSLQEEHTCENDGSKEKQNDFVTHPSGEGTFCVRKFTGQHWTLNLNKLECDCCEWQVTGIPCVHAVHLISHLRLPLAQFCSPFLSVKAYKSSYESNIKPISHESDWPEGNEFVLPPTLSRAPGRPKHNRIKGHDESETQPKNMKKCSKCLSFGHNKRSCQGGPIRGGASTSSGATSFERSSGRGGGLVAGRAVGVTRRGVGRVAKRGGGRAIGRVVGRGAGRPTGRGSVAS